MSDKIDTYLRLLEVFFVIAPLKNPGESNFCDKFLAYNS